MNLRAAPTHKILNRLPGWFKQDIPDENVLRIRRLISEFGVHTVCQEAKCPNISRCFKSNKATFIILGDICTRNCRFCAVAKAPEAQLGFDRDEPQRISELVKKIGLNYVVLTSVTRDDLSDGGASVFGRTIALIRRLDKKINIEVLIPDFRAKTRSLRCVIEAHPDVVAHNLETVARLYSRVRPMSDYRLSLRVLAKLKELNSEIITKSSLILGLGETKKEVKAVLKDIKGSGCDIVVMGQYLAPSPEHFPVERFLGPEEFEEYKNIAVTLGFRGVASGPLVRSSYQAEDMFKKITGLNNGK
ncbi:MAG: lipoyl synthase [Candidatus Omnitrophota bacterium]|nr:lipoyl synthase [Candidatus Omnitrophota bacterium]